MENKERVGILGYMSLAFAVVFFSGIFSGSADWKAALDFQTYVGGFGKICENAFGTGFVGTGGTGVKEGFMQALSIAPVMILSVAFISCVEYLGGLRAAQKLLTPVLKFLMGVPGICAIAMILNWQSSDASAAQARDLYESGKISNKERERLVAYEFITAATIGVFFSNGAVLLPYLTCATGVMLLVVLANKFVAANLIRLYQFFFEKNVPDTYAGKENK
ncbi:MAG: nucleoside recognition domain-containing protein [Erysipelotrichaceae bacterium]|nr:nucleoside recognition domain-containing protein [Erysipelotrichaceae bacterium]